MEGRVKSVNCCVGTHVNLLAGESTTSMSATASQVYMRRARLITAIVGIAVISLTQWSVLSNGLTKVANKILLVANVVRLYSREPDSKLTMPVPNVSRKRIANTWQAARGNSRRHDGQDIFAPRGTPVLSATEGYVTKVGENLLGGNTVSVIGAGGRVYYYAHLDQYAPNLSEGDHVTTETLLGYVGTTGNAQGTPPHLHFGVYTSAGAINPLPLLIDRLSNAKGAEARQSVSDKRTAKNRRSVLNS